MNILIIGASKSGKSAAILAKNLGNNVFVSELQTADNFKETIQEFDKYSINYEFGKNSIEKLQDVDLVITSPGVPREAEILIQAGKRNIEIISEVEYAYRNCNNPIIAVTGTNGKTTTTALIEFILNVGGKKAVAAGNIGLPFSDLIGKLEKDEIIVLEISSYQLDRIKYFRPEVAIITNITPDHLKYHKTMQDYVETKWKISCNQNENDLLILNYDDEILRKNPIVKSKIEYISVDKQAGGAFIREGKIILRNQQQKEEELMLVQQLSLPGKHNLYNSLAAIIATRAFEISNENIRDALSRFEGVNHRLEFVKTINGIKFINDSKATNVNSTWYALNSFNSPIIWIAGGRGDNNQYSELDESVAENVKKIICIGEEAENIAKHFCMIKECVIFDTLEEAVFDAFSSANENDVVLFSPACKSFDMFSNFEHRGEVFKEIVNKLV
jgi:UDP-N-acetylmuramoylalanine--D-glutamate ligase